MNTHRINPKTTARARALRTEMTYAERLLWQVLRHNQLNEHRFRRQHPIGQYIADFACIELKLVIELDGGQHQDQITYDEHRTASMKAQGWRVLRFWNNDVLNNLAGVLTIITENLTATPPTLTLPLSGGGNSSFPLKGGRLGWGLTYTNPMKNTEMMNTAVIGAGYAGMAAAARLAELDIPVTVFESARQTGGRARGVPHFTVRNHGDNLPPFQSPLAPLSPLTGGKSERPLQGDNLILDNGQHLLLGCYHQTLALIEQVGGNLEEDFLRLPLQLDLHGHFALKAPRLPAPFHLLFALLFARGLSVAERISAARFMQAMKKNNFNIIKDISVNLLLSEHKQSPALVKKFWEPLCIAALNTPLHIASARVLLNVLKDALNQRREDSDMLLPRIDFSALFPARAAKYVRKLGGHVLTSCGVEQLLPHEHGFEIITKRGSLHFSHVICAAPPVTAAKLLRPYPALAPVVAQIDALQHQPIYTLYLQYPKSVRLPHPMLGLHQRNSQWLFDKGQISGQHGLIAAVISAEGLHQEVSQDELAQRVIAELKDEFGFTEAPRWYKVIAEKRATFACTPNLSRPSQQTPRANLFLAGDYTKGDYPATLEGAVQSGLHCANIIRSQLPASYSK